MGYFTPSSVHQVQQRYEDVVLVDQAPASGSRSFSVWAVFDGHNGDFVSQLLARSMVFELEQRLPGAAVPKDEASHPASAEQYLYADLVRKAVLAAFLAAAVKVSHHLKSGESAGHGGASGCGSTATVAVQIGSLLTVANVGNTKCVLDVGHTAFECSSDHKLGNNEDEEERLDAIGACVARMKFDLSGPAAAGEEGCGPLRLWPGGLHMSRAIGGLDCGQAVIPHPYIQQVWLPRRASRMIIASGGVWESFETFQKAADALRDVSLPNAAAALLRRSLQHKQHKHNRGDLTVLVVDFVPEWGADYRSQVRLERLSCASASSNHSSHSVLPGHGVERKGQTSNLATQLSLKGMVTLPAAQGGQQHSLLQWGSGGSSPYLSPSSSRNHDRQQQGAGVLQRQGSLLQRLLPLLCAAPPSVLEHGSSEPLQQQLQQQQSGKRVLQHVGSFGSSSDELSSSRSGWPVFSWRSNKRASAAAAALAHDDPTTARIIARCDTFQVYFKGQYQPLEQQLAAIDRECSKARQQWDDVRAVADVAARPQQYRRPSPLSGSADGSSSGSGFRRTSSDMSVNSIGCFTSGSGTPLPVMI